MKHLLFTIFTLLTLTTFGQPTGNMEEDTARANRLYEEAIDSDKDDEAKISLLQEAIQLYEKYPFQDKQLEIYSRLAYIISDSGVDSLIIKYANQAIDLAKKNQVDELSPSLLYSYMALLKSYYTVNTKLAIENGEKALLIVNKPSAMYFEIQSLITVTYTYSQNLDSLRNSIVEIEQLIQHDSTWNNKLPFLYRVKMQLSSKENNYKKAITYGKQCIEINKKHLYYNKASIGPIYVEIGNVYLGLGEYQIAIDWMEKGYEISGVSPNSSSAATYYGNIGYAYSKMPNKKLKGIEYFKSALDIFYQDSITNAGAILVISNNISVYYFELDDYDNALLYAKKAMRFGNDPQLKSQYANILNRLERYDEALAIYQELIILYSQDFNDTDIHTNPMKYEVYSDDYWATLALINKSAGLIRRGRNDNIKDIVVAVETAKLAKSTFTRLLEKMRGFNQSKLMNSVQLKNISTMIVLGQYYHYKFTAHNTELDDLFETIEKRKSLLLLETLTPSMLPDSVTKKEEVLVKQMRRYEQKVDLAAKDSTEYYQTALFDATLALEKHIRETRVVFPKEVNNLYNIEYPNVSTIQKSLTEKELIINYTICEEEIILIYLISNKNKQVIKIELEDTFFDKVQSIKQLFKKSLLIQDTNRKKFITLSNDLYKVLIAPIAKELSDKKQLIIIPENELFNLPFEVLLPTNEQKPFNELDFLIKNYDISYQYSATIYSQLKNKPAIEDKSLLAFAPVFTGDNVGSTRAIDFLIDSLYRGVENERFAALPNTKLEVQTIAKTLEGQGQTTVLLESDATKVNYNKAVQKQQYQFVHIATHGLVNFQNPRLSALACYSETDDVEQQLLFANEIQMQDIQADLVVLSSCESGIGQLVAGEGLIALNRSYIYSGANNVMFSLWKVSDTYSAELMINFYKFYLETNDYSAALRQAKLKMLKDPKTANPRYWAAFVLIGE